MSPAGGLLAYVGGVRSGKSAAAQLRFEAEVSRRGLRSPVHLGTLSLEAAAWDAGVAERIKAHRGRRPPSWAGVDVGGDLPEAARACLAAGHDAWLLDGLGAWAALHLEAPAAAEAALQAFLELGSGVGLRVLVLDEVGGGGVAAHPAARAFADLNGLLNQRIAALCDEVWSVQVGLARRLK